MFTRFIFRKVLGTLKNMQSVVLVISSSVFFSAFVSMGLLTLNSNFSSILIDGVDEDFGGNVAVEVLDSSNGDNLSDYLEELKQSGKIEDYAKITSGYGGTLNLSDELNYTRYFGIWDNDYPIVGELKLLNTKKSAFELLKNDNDIILSKEFSEKYGVKVGDEVSYIDRNYLDVEYFKVVGFIDVFPTSETEIGILRGETAEKLLTPTATKVLVTGDEEKIKNELTSKFGEDVYFNTLSEAIESNKNTSKYVGTFLGSISILGIFVGSLGIATSMNIVIARRKGEIGILKTIGYTKAKVFIMFLSELTIIALIGNFLGIVGGFFFSNYLKDLLTALGTNVALDMSFDWKSALISSSASLFSAILFSVIAINNYVSIKPLNLIKDISEKEKFWSKVKKYLAYIFVLAVFGGISILVTGSVQFGLGAVGASVLGFAIASFLMLVVLALILLIPFRVGNVLGLAWKTLKTSYKRYVLATMSIFVGLTVLCLLLSLYNTADDEFANQEVSSDIQMDIVAYLENKDVRDEIEKYLDSADGVNDYYEKLRVEARQDFYIWGTQVLEGRDVGENDYQIEITEGEVTKDGILISNNYRYSSEIGDEEVLTINGEEYSFEISGFYNEKSDFRMGTMESTETLGIISRDLFTSTVNDYQKIILVDAKPEYITEVSENISSYGDVIIMNSEILANLFNSQIDVLEKLFLSTSGLALVAGVILIINAVSLEVVNRRRSFGIYKAVGFSGNQVRNMFLFEYVILLFIVSALAIGASYSIIWIFDNYSEAIFGFEEHFSYDLPQCLSLVGISSALILGLIILISARTLKTKPLEILRYE